MTHAVRNRGKGPKINFSPKFFLKNFFRTQNKFQDPNFSGPKFFRPEILFVPKTFSNQNFYGPKIFSDQIFFQKFLFLFFKIFFVVDQNFFSTKVGFFSKSVMFNGLSWVWVWDIYPCRNAGQPQGYQIVKKGLI